MYKDYEIVFDKETKQQRVFRYSRGGVIRNKTIAEIAPLLTDLFHVEQTALYSKELKTNLTKWDLQYTNASSLLWQENLRFLQYQVQMTRCRS